MKHISVSLPVFFLVAFNYQVKAQAPRSLKNQKSLTLQEENESYFSFTWNEGILKTQNTAGTFSIQFPYKLIDPLTKNFIAGTVQKKFTNVLSPDLTMRDFFGFEASFSNKFISFHFGGLHNTGGMQSGIAGLYGSIGFGYNFYLLGRGDHLPDKRILIKPSLNLCVSGFNLGLARFDDTNKDVDALGYMEHGARPDSGQKKTTGLSFTFNQRSFCLMPQISVGNNPFRNTLHWSVNVSYLLPLLDHGFIKIKQDGITDGDGDYDGPGSKSPVTDRANMQSPGLTATFNDKTVDRSPYSLHGFYFGFTLGVNIAAQ